MFLNKIDEYKIPYDKEKINIRYLGSFNHGKSVWEDEDKITILTCSSVVPVKQMHFIPEILSKVKSKVKWIHIGDGPLFNEIVELTKAKLDGLENVEYEFKGKYANSDVISFYQNNKVDLFLNVSKSEGLPVSIMEATSFGVPVIATDVGGTHEIVDKGNGYLLNPTDFVDEAAKIIDDFAKLTKEEKIQMRTNSRNKWEKQFNIEEQSKQFYEKLEELL